jgi:fructokinase
MILAVGEILADMVGVYEDNALVFKTFCGGAVYNVAVNAKKAGAKVAFIGRVGDDVIGRYLLEESKRAKFDRFDVQVDPYRSTTLAFVSLKDGERDFTFNRNDTADYNIDFDSIDFSSYTDVNMVDLGSLMLSEPSGREFAYKIAEKTRAMGAKLCFDVNFRMDTYSSFDEAKKAYAPFVEMADVVKFSEDELCAFTGEKSAEKAIAQISKPNKLVLLTLGSKGSAYYLNGKSNVVPTVPVKPVDTTGAGDAFFGTFLATLEGNEWTEENLEFALKMANEAGAKTTQFLGAVKFD